MTTPYPFQETAAKRIHELGGRALVSCDPGLGKSLISLLFSTKYAPTSRPIIIVCPAGLKWNWEAECAKHFNLRAEVLSGMKPNRRKVIFKPKIVIVNYDILKGWIPFLLDMNPQIVIIDESQYILNHLAIRSKAVDFLCKDVPNVIALTGTPLVNRPIELWMTLNVLFPKRFGSRWKFAHKYCGPKKGFFGWDFNGASNIPELHNRLKKVSIRYRIADVLKDLPEKQLIVQPMAIQNPKEYDKALNNFIGWMQDNYTLERANKAAKAERLVQLGVLKRLAAELKMKSIYEWIDNFLIGSDEKIILFCVHKRIIEMLSERYGKESVTVDGSVTGHKRQLAVEKFLTNKKTRIFIGQIKAAGVGWSAKGVSTVAFVEFPWSPGLVQQGIGRAFGINRGSDTTHTRSYFLVGKDTIEEDLVKLLQKKQVILSSVLDGEGKGDQLNIFDELCRILQRKQK